MSLRPRPSFVETERYRLRRLRDGALVLPLVGLILWLLPLVRAPAETDRADTANGLVYIFVVWALLIVASAALSVSIGRAERRHSDKEADGEAR